MAEKNTESTAVNQLIELVATAKPLPPDPDEDLMFREKPAPKAKQRAGANRAGEVEPLPRTRAPVGTQQGLKTITNASGPHQTIRAVPPGVRITTAPPQRSVTIPPLTLDPNRDRDRDHEDEDTEVTNPGLATFARPTSQGLPAPFAPGSTPPPPPTPRVTGSQAAVRPSAPKPMLPPPVPTMRASSPPPVPGTATPPFRPSAQPTTNFSYPLVPGVPGVPGAPAVSGISPLPAALPHPKQMPAVAPEQLDVDVEVEVDADADPIASILEPKPLVPRVSSSWMEHDIGTQQVPKRNDWKVIAGKLIGPMIALVIAGIFIGGYFAFDGDGGKQRAPKVAEGQTITMQATTAADPSTAPSMPNTDESKAAAANTAASNTAASNTANTAASNTASTAASNTADSNTANTAASNTANTAASNTANTAASNTADSNTANIAASNGANPANIAASNGANPANTAAPNTATNTKPVTPPNLAASSARTSPAPTTPPNLAASSSTTSSAPTMPTTPSNARPTLVDVRIDSNPIGATVTLIDRGKSTYLGTTPVSAAVDSSRKYELVFSYENRSTVVQALDPATQKRVSVKLTAASRVVSTSKVAKAETPKAETPKAETPKAETPKTETKTAPPKADKPDALASKGGQGTLMISSKPPCEILVDGTPTGLTTPQRSISLPAGMHKITLVNTAEGIKKTMSVQITADKPTKVIQDFMK